MLILCWQFLLLLLLLRSKLAPLAYCKVDSKPGDRWVFRSRLVCGDAIYFIVACVVHALFLFPFNGWHRFALIWLCFVIRLSHNKRFLLRNGFQFGIEKDRLDENRSCTFSIFVADWPCCLWLLILHFFFVLFLLYFIFDVIYYAVV